MGRPDLQALNQLILSGKAETVLEELQRATEAEPAHVACHVLLAQALEASGNTEDALRAWRRAYVLCPDSPVIRDELRRLAAEIACDAARETRLIRAGAPAVAEATGAADDAAEKSLKDDEPYHDLDDLIKEIETARIVPDPDVETVESGRLEADVEDVVSETLAKIYANQRFFEEAARVYDKLAVQQPDRRTEFLEKATEIRERIK